MLTELHFQEPLWLLALIPLAFVFWLASKTTTNSKAWGKVIDPKLLPLLLQGEDKNTVRAPKVLVCIAWIIAVVALADPVWEKIPRPVYQTNAARVLVLDLSNSMIIDDLKPNRLARARFKIEDILSREEEGQTGLVLFAGEAFTAVPLTRDTETIRALLKDLTPQIMPAQGSRADLGLMKAHELLRQAGNTNGQVLLITDGSSQKSASLTVAESLKNDGHTVSVMGVGTEEGGQLNFRNDTSVTVKLETDTLKDIARSGGGNYHLISTNNSDLNDLLIPISDNSIEENQESSDVSENQEWQSTGPYLVLFLLPLAALAFRKGWLLNVSFVFICFGLMTQSQVVIAEEVDEERSGIQWDNVVEILSKNKSQRANNALINEQYEKARDLSDDSFSKGSAEYKLENYEDALQNFKQSKGADARYNEGNTLTKLNKYEEAIAAYDQALKLNPEMQDAIDNKKAIEDFLKKQEEQQSEENQSSDENQQNDSNEENQDQKNEDNQEDQQSQSDEQNEESQDDQNKQNSESTSNDDNQQEAEQDKSESQENDQDNQFSDANKDLDKQAEEESESDPSEDQSSEQDETQEPDQKNKISEEAQQSDESQEEPVDSNQIGQAEADELSAEEKMAAEQWLRRIPDDPGGLLRRKFRYQYNNRRKSTNSTEKQPW